MKNHKHYDLAYNAYRNISFSPEKRAAVWCESFDESIGKLRDEGIEESKINRYEALWVKYMNAKSGCASTMITGSANFNTSRNQKAMAAERKAGDACFDYYDKILADAKEESFYKENPNARPVKSGDSDAIERLKEKLISAMDWHETMLKVNKILRKKNVDMVVLSNLLGSEDEAKKRLNPNFAGRIGFKDFELVNNRAKIKHLQNRINAIEKRKATTPKEIEINGVKLKENNEVMRIQIFFNGKPSAAIIFLLKSHAFKWAPSVGAWQRQLTNNAIDACNKFIIPALREIKN